MPNSSVTKIYSLKTTGYSELHKQFQQITKDLVTIKTAAQQMQAAIATAGSTQGIQAYRTELQRIRIEEAELSRQSKQLAADMKAQQLQRQEQIKQLRDATALQNAQAQAAALAARQQQQAARQTTASLQAEAGSYTDTYNKAKQLYALIKPLNASSGTAINFNGQTLSYQQAITEFERLSAAEQAFRRQFTADKTLVGEYTTGIVQAFKSMGLDDLINNQVTRATQRMQFLVTESQELKNAFLQIRSGGQQGFDALNTTLQAIANSTGGLDARFQTLHDIIQRTGNDSGAALQQIEQHLINSTNESQQLGRQIATVQTGLRGMGDIGDRLVTGLANGFRNIIGQLTQFAIGFFGVQAAIQGVMSAFDKTIALDSLNSALRLVSGSTQELAINEQFLADMTNRLGLEYLGTAKAFKGFYAAATLSGISAEETRKVFESVAAASAKLKLTQEDTNGVMLALSQIASKGTVAAQELKQQIGERLPGAYELAAKAMGKTVQEFTKLQESGQILATDFLPKFAEELQKTFGGNTTEKIDGLQATINRFSNRFTKFLNDNNKAIAGFLSGVIGLLSALTGLISLLPAIAIITALWAASWAIANKEIVIANAQLLYYNARIIINRILLGAATVAQNLFTAAMYAYNIAARVATATANLFGIAIGGWPLKIILALLAAGAAAIAAFAQRTKDATAALSEQARIMKLSADITKEANKAIAEQQNKVAVLASIVKDLALSEYTHKKAMDELIAIDPAFQKTFVDGKINLTAFNEVLKDYNANLLQKAKLEAAGNRSTELYQNLVKLEEVQRTFQLIRSGKDVKGFGELSDFEKTFLPNDIGSKRAFNFTSSLFNERLFQDELDKALANVDAAIKKTAVLKKDNDKFYTALFDAANPPPPTTKPISFAERFKALQTNGGTEADFKLLKDDIDKKKAGLNILSKEYIALGKLEDQIANILNPKDKGADKLSTDENNNKNSLDARLKYEIATLEEEFAQRRKNHELSVNEEIEYLTKLNDINNKYTHLKIDSIRGNNAAEKAQRAELRKNLIDNDIKLSEDIQAVYKKDFDSRAAIIKKGIDTTIAQIKQGLAEFDNDPTVSNRDKAQAAADANNLILQQTTQYYNDLLTLAQQDKQKTEAIEQEKQKAIADIIAAGADDQKNINTASIQDYETQGELRKNIVKTQYAEIRKEILENSSLTEKERTAQLETFQRAEEREVAAIELDVLNKIVAFKKGLFAKGLISEADYDAVLAQQKAKAEEVTKLGIINITDSLDQYDGSIKGFINTLSLLLKKTDFFNKQIGDSGISLGYVLSQSFDLAKSAMNDYFDAQAERVKEDKELQEKRLDIELEQRKARSQSAAESAALDKEYQAKKDELTKQAGEKLKKQKKAEVLIALAAEEANIAVQAAANPLNAVTFGGAGLTQFAILSGIAIAKAALQIAAINSQQFEYGGEVKKGKNNGGGISKGKTHAQGGNKFMFDGEVYEDEINEIRVIRTKDAEPNKRYSIAGTQAQIASALNVLGGGHSFQPGAMLKRFEWGGGITLQKFASAPSFSASQGAAGGGVSSDDMHTMFANMMNMTAAINNRIDRLEVVQDIDTVTKAQSIKAKQKQNSTL